MCAPNRLSQIFMAGSESPEYRTLRICADEFKRLLGKQKNRALESLLNKFVHQSDGHANSLEEGNRESEGSTCLVNSMIEVVRHYPRKYHEFLKELEAKLSVGKNATSTFDSVDPRKDVATLEALYRSLSQTYCLGSDKISLLHQFEDIKSNVLNAIKNDPTITPQHLLDTLNFLEFSELKNAYEKYANDDNRNRRKYVLTGLFQKMSCLFTFTGFSLLQHIAKMLKKNKNLRGSIKLYDCRVKEFKARTTVKNLMNCPPCQHDFPPKFSVFRVEIQGCTSITLKTLDALKDDFCEAIEQKRLCNVLNFIGVHNMEQVRSKETTVPSFCAVWRFPSILEPMLKEATERNGSAFCKTRSILSISIDGTELVKHEEKIAKCSRLNIHTFRTIILGLIFILGFITIILSTAFIVHIYQQRIRLDDEVNERLMNLLTNHSFEMMRGLMSLERQENYTYTYTVVLLILLVLALFLACMKNTSEIKADLHRALEKASNSRLQQMVELSSISYERHQQYVNGGPAPMPIQSTEDTQ